MTRVNGALAPAPSVARVQVTVPLDDEQLQPVPVAESKDVSAGNGYDSESELASDGPALLVFTMNTIQLPGRTEELPSEIVAARFADRARMLTLASALLFALDGSGVDEVTLVVAASVPPPG